MGGPARSLSRRWWRGRGAVGRRCRPCGRRSCGRRLATNPGIAAAARESAPSASASWPPGSRGAGSVWDAESVAADLPPGDAGAGRTETLQRGGAVVAEDHPALPDLIPELGEPGHDPGTTARESGDRQASTFSAVPPMGTSLLPSAMPAGIDHAYRWRRSASRRLGTARTPPLGLPRVGAPFNGRHALFEDLPRLTAARDDG